MGTRHFDTFEHIWGAHLGTRHFNVWTRFPALGLRSSARIAREVELASLFQFQLFEIGADILHYCRSSKASLFRIGSESVA